MNKKRSFIGLIASFVTILTISTVSNTNSQRALSVVAQEQGVPEMPIVMYHSILPDKKRLGDYVITPQQFKNDLLYLKEKGYETVLPSQVVDYVTNGVQLPEKPVMITFDDGYYNNYEYVYPILKELNMKAVISVVAKFSENFTKTGEENVYWSHLKTDRIYELANSGFVEIGNHSYNLHNNNKGRKGVLKTKGESHSNYIAFLIDDTNRAQAFFESAGIDAPIVYAYPFGAVNNDSEAIIRDMGFCMTLGCQEGINYLYDQDSLHRMKRYNRPNGKTSVQFFERIFNL